MTGARASKPEDGYRVRRFGSATFYTSRRAFDDLTIVVKRFPGVETGPDFVLVHGIGVSSRYFHPVAAELAKVGRVWLVDLPGYGSAPDPKRDVTIDDHARVLGRFLDAADITSPVLVGHSMGCQIVASLAARRPTLSESIVLIGPTMPPDEREFWTATRLLMVDIWREPLAVKWVNFTDYFFRCGVPYMLRQVPHLLADRIEVRFPSITASTLVIVGDADPIVSREWAAEVASLGAGRLEVVDGPHVVMYTDPVRVSAAIARHSAR